MDGQQLDRRDAQRLHVVDDFTCAEAFVRAPELLRHSRMPLREASHVSLVDDRVVPGNTAGTRLAFPVEVRIDHHALGNEGRAVTLVEREIVAFGPDRVAEAFGRPLQLTDVRAGVGIEQQLVGVESMPGLGLVRPVHSQAVYRARVHLGDVAVPEAIGVLRQDESLELLLALRIEQAHVDTSGVRREACEVSALAVPDGAVLLGGAFANTTGFERGHGGDGP